jgi:hypothetical protein
MRLAAAYFEAARKVVDVDGLVLQEDVLLLVDGDDHALFGELIDGAGLGDRDFDAGLKHRCGEHEDEQKHKDDVDQRSDVDLGERGLGASFCQEKAMTRKPPLAGLVALALAASSLAAFSMSVEEFAAEVVHAGTKLAQPGGELVVADDGGDGDDEAGGGGDECFGDAGRDGAEGGGACGAEAVEGVDDAHDGAEEADEGSALRDGGEPGHAALHVRQGLAGAVCAARSRATGLRGRPRPPDWRWYSSWISLKTATSGLGLNCSATAAISLRRPDWRKARRKRENAGQEQGDEDGECDGAGVVDRLHESAAARGCGSCCGGRVVLKEEG